MSKYLIKNIETYRVDSEPEAKQLIEDAKKDRAYTLSKYSSEYKCTKVKGEIDQEWFRVVLTKDFNVEKEPDRTIEVKYEAHGNFPSINNNEYDEGVDF